MTFNKTLKQRWTTFAKKTSSIILGSILFAVGVVAMLNADMGMNTWAVLDCGLIKHVDISLGLMTQVTGFIALGVGWAMGFPPGFATLISIFTMGNAIDLVINMQLIPQPASTPGKLGLIILSAICFGIGTLYYVKPELGAGPRDSLMMGLIKRLSYPVAYIRIGLELAVIIIGWLLGGPVGIGTLLSTILVGYSVDLAFKLGGYNRETTHMGFSELYRHLTETR